MNLPSPEDYNPSSPEDSRLRERLEQINRVQDKIVHDSNLDPAIISSQIENFMEFDELMSQFIDDYWSNFTQKQLEELGTAAYPLLNPEPYSEVQKNVSEDLFDKFIKTTRKYVNSVLAAAKLNESNLKNSDFSLRHQLDVFRSMPEESLYKTSKFYDLYEADFYAWAQEQSKLIQNRSWDSLDIPNLVEEIDSLGRQERR